MSMLSLRSKLHSAIRQTRKPSTGRSSGSPKGVVGADANDGGRSSSSSSVPPLAGSSPSAAGGGESSSSAPQQTFAISLCTLPAELLRKIASCCDIADILSLSRTSRQLRDLLDDPLVYQESLRLHVSGHCFFSNVARNGWLARPYVAWPEPPPVLTRTPTCHWLERYLSLTD